MPYHRLDPKPYLRPTFLGSRTTVYQASIGCPYQCNFCGVVDFSGSREKVEPPERTVEVLAQLQRDYGVNAVQFYDNNFFMREDHARELAERMIPLGMNWWCETRVDCGAAVFGRHHAEDSRVRLRHDFLRRRIGIEPEAERDEERDYGGAVAGAGRADAPSSTSFPNFR